MLKFLFLEEFAVLYLNMAGFLEVVQRSHTGGSLRPMSQKKFFSHQIFSHFLKLHRTDFLHVDRGRDDYYS